MAVNYCGKKFYNIRPWFYHKGSVMVSAQHDVDQILGAVRILEGEHLGAAAGEIDHGLGRRAALQGLVAAEQLGVGLLQQG